MRLCEETLDALPKDVVRPSYKRSGVQEGIVHLGIGAFHRAHQAAFTDTVLASGDKSWGIVGADVVSDASKRALQPQNGLYTLSQRDGDGERMRVIGSIVRVLGAPDDNVHLLALMASATTRIVSMTVTEKGYCIDVPTGVLRRDLADIAADLANPNAPKTVLGFIVEALRLRRDAGIPPFTVLSCDNLPHNGALARKAVLAFATEVDAALADWIAHNVAFPSTMVDRITPATTDEDRERVSARIGMQDAWPVVTEPFCQWVIEDKFTMGRPAWELAGAIFTDDIERWENMKLRCLNGAHSTLSYLGQLCGAETVADAMHVPMIQTTLSRLWPEIREVLDTPAGIDPIEYIESLRKRFLNPALKHRTVQIASDGTQKLPQRLVAPWRDRIAKGMVVSPGIATGIAAWMHFALRETMAKGAAGLSDPLAGEVAERAARSTAALDIVGNLLAMEAVFGVELGRNPDVRRQIEEKFVELGTDEKLRTAPGVRY